MLDCLFKPQSVAIVGASSDPNKIGGRPLAFLKKAGYRGAIYPINPSARTVQDLPAFESLAKIGKPVEQAIIALPAAAVLPVLDQAIAAGVKAVQIFAAGFAEQDAAGRSSQEILRGRAKAAGVRVLGPNSLGLFNTHAGFFGTFATALDGAWPRAGSVGVATQSGAFGSYCFALAHQRGVGFSSYIATGNESDVDVAECIDHLAEDPDTRVIVAAMEGCRDGRKLAASLAKARAAGKPVFVMKVGASQAGAAAATTHTGSLASSDAVFDAVFRDCGVHRARSLEELVDAAYAASVGVLAKGPRLAVATTSGGIGVLMADAASEAGMELPPVSADATAKIKARVPLAAGANPVDTSAQIIGDLTLYAGILEEMLAGGGYDAVACYLAHIGRNPAHWGQLREPLYALRRKHAELPFAAVMLTDEALRQDLEVHGFAVFEDPSRAVKALGALVSKAPCEQPGIELPAPAAFPPPPLTERQAKQLLSAAGVPVAPERVAKSAEEAAAAARDIGFPVVAKILSPDVAHKTEIGGVITGLATQAAVSDAFATLMRRASERAPQARIEGVLVARMMSGVETLIGVHQDPVFGPVVTFGAGGVLTELVRDAVVALAPVSVERAKSMISETRILTLLNGYRGSKPCNVDALAECIAALSRFAAANAGRVAGIDLNPVVATPEGAWALDALIELKEAA